jgi:putative transposase
MFDKKAGTARRKYNAFVQNGISKGKRPDLIGGGLIRSTGGWSALKAQLKISAIANQGSVHLPHFF